LVQLGYTVLISPRLIKAMSNQDYSELYQISYLYYKEEKTYEAIAEALGLTRQAVSKKLKESEKVGIVTHVLMNPDPKIANDLTNLAFRVKQKYCLQEIFLVMGTSYLTGERASVSMTVNPTQKSEKKVIEIKRKNLDVISDICEKAAQHFDRVVQNLHHQKTPPIVAVTGGQTFVRKVVAHLKPTAPIEDL
jgi:DNA-binding transcriptional regulator LsrR (DeoR family)